jgi:hypothetical protein
MSRLLFTLILFSLPFAYANAAEITVEKYAASDEHYIQYHGPVVDGDAEKLEETIKANPSIKWLFLHSPGGNLIEGKLLAQIVNQYEMNTAVNTSGRCASACPLLFHAGKQRWMARDAVLGYHAASQSHFNNAESLQEIFETGQYLGLALGLEYVKYWTDSWAQLNFLNYFRNILRFTGADEMHYIDAETSVNMRIATGWTK